MTPDEIKERIARVKGPLTYLDGGMVLYSGKVTYVAFFGMDKRNRTIRVTARPDDRLSKTEYPVREFYIKLAEVCDFNHVTMQDRIAKDLLSRKPKPATYSFAEDKEWLAGETARLGALTLDHTVPILRFDLQWSLDGDRESFAGALLATKQQQFLFELANKG
jgi:hypothetical protein